MWVQLANRSISSYSSFNCYNCSVVCHFLVHPPYVGGMFVTSSSPTGRIYLGLRQTQWCLFPHSPLPLFLPARWVFTPVTVVSKWLKHLIEFMSVRSLFSMSARCRVCFLGLVQSFSHYSAVSQRWVSQTHVPGVFLLSIHVLLDI